MRADFRAQDFQQDRVDTGWLALRMWQRLGFDSRLRLLGRCEDRFGFDNRFEHRLRLGDKQLRHVQYVFAGGDTIGDGLHRVQIGLDAALAGQRSVQLWQGIGGLADQCQNGWTGWTGPFENAVEHALDLPAELAECECANQPPTALEGMEHTPHRSHAIIVVRRLVPDPQHLPQADDLLVQFFEEHFADFVVDVFAAGFKADWPECRFRRRQCTRGGCGKHWLGMQHIRGCDQIRSIDFGTAASGAIHRADRNDIDSRRCIRYRFFDRGFGLHFGDCEQVFGGLRNRPVAERNQACFSQFEDAFALRTAIAQCLQVIFQTRKRIGQTIHLQCIGHPLLAQQFEPREHTQGMQLFGRTRQFEYLHRARDFIQQSRHVFELGMIPARFDETHETLPRLHEIGNRFLDQRIQRLLRFVRRQRGRILLAARLDGVAQPCDLIVEGSFDIQQGASDIQQRGLIGRTRPAGERLDRAALILHHATWNAEAEHAERIGDCAQCLALRRQIGDYSVRRAQMQIERFLDPQQIFLDAGGDGVEQFAIVAGKAAARVRKFGLVELLRIQAEYVADLADTTMVGRRVDDVIQQLADQLGRRRGQECRFAIISKTFDLPLHAGQRLLERLGRGECPRAQRIEGTGGDPEQLAWPFGLGQSDQLRADIGQRRNAASIVVITQPLQQRNLIGIAQHFNLIVPLRFRQRRQRAARRGWQRTREVGDEQHAFRHDFLAARLAQLVEQRQQYDWNVLVSALQAFQIIRQLHRAAHQRGVSLLAILDAAFQQRLRQVLHLFGHHRCAVQFEHAQRALHLMQLRDANLHLATVATILGVRLQRLTSLPEGFVELRLDPAQGGEIDVLMQPHPEILSARGRIGTHRPRCVVICTQIQWSAVGSRGLSQAA